VTSIQGTKKSRQDVTVLATMYRLRTHAQAVTHASLKERILRRIGSLMGEKKEER